MKNSTEKNLKMSQYEHSHHLVGITKADHYTKDILNQEH
jgi:hypothetical protein